MWSTCVECYRLTDLYSALLALRMSSVSKGLTCLQNISALPTATLVLMAATADDDRLFRRRDIQLRPSRDLTD
jgi:hypothetical protein